MVCIDLIGVYFEDNVFILLLLFIFIILCCILFDLGDTDEELKEETKPLPLLIPFTVINNDVAFDIHIIILSYYTIYLESTFLQPECPNQKTIKRTDIDIPNALLLQYYQSILPITTNINNYSQFCNKPEFSWVENSLERGYSKDPPQ